MGRERIFTPEEALERGRARQRAYYRENREKLRAYAKKYYRGLKSKAFPRRRALIAEAKKYMDGYKLRRAIKTAERFFNREGTDRDQEYGEGLEFLFKEMGLPSCFHIPAVKRGRKFHSYQLSVVNIDISKLPYYGIDMEAGLVSSQGAFGSWPSHHRQSHQGT
jgi:hypothetical protein